jgi:glycosyltransferase involved in cell wall biosynthesis
LTGGKPNKTPNKSICLVVNGFFLANGKAAQARLLAAKLHEAGVCVCVIDRYKYKNDLSSKCAFEITDVPFLPEGIKIFRIPAGSRQLIKQLWRIRSRYQVVCFRGKVCLAGCFAFLRLLGKKTVVIFAARYRQKTSVPWYKNPWYLVNRFVAVSATLEQDLKDIPGIKGKVSTILNRVDQKAIRELNNREKNILRKNLKLNPSDKIVIFVGGVQNSKGIDILLDAWKLIRERVTEARLLILGPLCSLCQDNIDYHGLTQDGKDLLNKKMEIFTSKLSPLMQLHERITYLGVKSNVSDYLAASDVFVFPSRTEGSPNAPKEAMAACLPVVTFDNKEIIGEIVRDGHEGILVTDGDSKALAEAAILLLNNDNKRKRLGRNARLRFKNEFIFDDRQTKRFTELFNNL